MPGNENITLLTKYFPGFSPDQNQKLLALEGLYRDWNVKINVVSRQDIDHLFVHHILHSLAFCCFESLRNGSTVLDVGTGGGFPGIPLAIVYPGVHFTLIDGRAKKIKVAQDIATNLELTNVTTMALRSEELNEKFDVIMGRAITEANDFIYLVRKNLKPLDHPDQGVFYWTGGRIPYLQPRKFRLFKIEKVFTEDYFKDKYIVGVKGF